MKSKVVIIRWIQAAAWMLLIFSVSTDLGSTEHSSRFIGPFLRWFNPAISDETIGHVQLFVRKCAHVVEYAILAILVWRALAASLSPVKCYRRDFLLTMVIGFLYAVSDEVHQAFVPSRTGSPWDVLIDTFGLMLGLFAVRLFGKWKKWW